MGECHSKFSSINESKDNTKQRQNRTTNHSTHWKLANKTLKRISIAFSLKFPLCSFSLPCCPHSHPSELHGQSHIFFTKGNMEKSVGLLFLVVLSAACAGVARELPNDLIGSNAAKYEISEQTRRPDVCALCEQYTAMALDYLNANKTQSEIIETLHHSCSQLHSFKQQCITLVDYYAPLFFLEVASVQPEDFCKSVNLCREIEKISSLVQENSCGFCKDAVAELLVKLKDPDTELEIIQALLKACNSMDKYATKCKSMIFEYGPVILANAEKFLETTDICTALHACKAPTEAIQQEIALFSDS
ncbi:hypothetical protein L6164_000174 [Bauhinia variegata]|uniref:Uncharacterized protein n=1 Tax=Bauhinia variegata TaxID=167791 RepID=A0ACB9Q540_BAUVA|nr:hypothetical protein L6164_000174 [Bauhinia variegata]